MQVSQERQKLLDHLSRVHGLEVLETSPETLHEQDHQPGHGYHGQGWSHPVTDVYSDIEDD